MKLLKFSTFFIVSILIAGAQPQPNEKTQTVVIRAGILLDGKGHALHNVLVVVQSGKIVRVEPNAKEQRVPGAASYDLSRMTVMPGWIDLHDHITWHFGPNGRIEDKSETRRRPRLPPPGMLTPR